MHTINHTLISIASQKLLKIKISRQMKGLEFISPKNHLKKEARALLSTIFQVFR